DRKTPTTPAPTSGLRWNAAFPVAARQWNVVVRRGDDYLTAHRSIQSWAILTGALLFTSLLGSFLLVLTGRTAKVESLVAARTRELVEANAAAERANRAKSDFL